MPCANRYWLSGHVWHLTHRCHRRQFLLRFGRDRRLWTRWLCEARVRHELCVLDYVVTSNHVHLVVRDRHAQTVRKEGKGARYNPRLN
jgi:putative transposase